jgi:heme exporter protein D
MSKLPLLIVQTFALLVVLLVVSVHDRRRILAMRRRLS